VSKEIRSLLGGENRGGRGTAPEGRKLEVLEAAWKGVSPQKRLGERKKNKERGILLTYQRGGAGCESGRREDKKRPGQKNPAKDEKVEGIRPIKDFQEKRK